MMTMISIHELIYSSLSLLYMNQMIVIMCLFVIKHYIERPKPRYQTRIVRVPKA